MITPKCGSPHPCKDELCGPSRAWNDEKFAGGRTFPFAALPALEMVLRRQRDYRSAVERRLGGRATLGRHELTSQKTESVYNRYVIVAEQDLRDGVAKLAALHTAGSRTVLPFESRTITVQSGGGEGGQWLCARRVT